MIAPTIYTQLKYFISVSVVIHLPCFSNIFWKRLTLNGAPSCCIDWMMLYQRYRPIRYDTIPLCINLGYWTSCLWQLITHSKFSDWFCYVNMIWANTIVWEFDRWYAVKDPSACCAMLLKHRKGSRHHIQGLRLKVLLNILDKWYFLSTGRFYRFIVRRISDFYIDDSHFDNKYELFLWRLN